MTEITGVAHLFKWKNLHSMWQTKYVFAALYVLYVLRNNCLFV